MNVRASQEPVHPVPTNCLVPLGSVVVELESLGSKTSRSETTLLGTTFSDICAVMTAPLYSPSSLISISWLTAGM